MKIQTDSKAQHEDDENPRKKKMKNKPETWIQQKLNLNIFFKRIANDCISNTLCKHCKKLYFACLLYNRVAISRFIYWLSLGASTVLLLSVAACSGVRI